MGDKGTEQKEAQSELSTEFQTLLS